jgi:hypothetical protein
VIFPRYAFSSALINNARSAGDDNGIDALTPPLAGVLGVLGVFTGVLVGAGLFTLVSPPEPGAQPPGSW